MYPFAVIEQPFSVIADSSSPGSLIRRSLSEELLDPAVLKATSADRRWLTAVGVLGRLRCVGSDARQRPHRAPSVAAARATRRQADLVDGRCVAIGSLLLMTTNF